MKTFKEWKISNGSSLVNVGPYSIEIKQVETEKILLSVYLDKKMMQTDSNANIKKVIDLSDLRKPKQVGMTLSGPPMEPMDNRNSNQPSA